MKKTIPLIAALALLTLVGIAYWRSNAFHSEAPLPAPIRPAPPAGDKMISESILVVPSTPTADRAPASAAAKPPIKKHQPVAAVSTAPLTASVPATPALAPSTAAVRSSTPTVGIATTAVTAAPARASAPLNERLLSQDPAISNPAQSEIPKLSDEQKTKLAFSILETVKSVADVTRQKQAAEKAGPVLVHLGPAAFPALIKGLSDSVPVIRMKSAYALGAFGAFAKEAMTPLIKNAAKDPDVFAKCDAIDALGKMGPIAERAVPELAADLKDPNDLVRFHAVEAVGNIGPKAARAVPELIKILEQDADVYTRGSAAQALGQMGAASAPAVRDLVAAAKSKDQRLRSLALAALRQIGTPDALAAAAKFQKQ
jgi:HEAT repeat protein